MPYPFALGGTLLRAQRCGLSTSFCRYKSITAAIEKGRQSGPGRFSSARPRTDLKDDRPRTQSRDDRPRTFSRDDRPRTFSRDDRPRTFSREDRPRTFSREDGPRPAFGRDSRDSRDNRTTRDNRDASDDSATRPRPSRPSRSGSSIGARRRRWENDDGPNTPRQDSDFTRRPRDDDTRFNPRSPGASDSRATRSERRSAPSDSFASRDRTDRTERTDRYDRNDRNDRDHRSDDASRPLRKTERRLEARLNKTSDRPRDARYGSRDATRDSRDAPARGTTTRADPGPDSLPYTTAASDFIYGYSSVLAAIKANRRKFYRLYVSQRGMSRDAILASARAANLRDITVHVGDEYARAMDKASSGRPHNVRLPTHTPPPQPPS
jgi:21S rRNA (GM2251-2'-O)-methyltransferase